MKFTTQQILELAKQFPRELKLRLIKEWMEELSHPSIPDVQLKGYSDPINLDEATFTEDMLKPLEELWQDDLSAEELYKLCSK
ncbi:MAG: hypothetical protein AAF573_15825 [Bacteroidota bacterium]